MASLKTPPLWIELNFKSTLYGDSSYLDLAVSLESYQQSESSQQQQPFSDYFQNRDAKRFISAACRCSTFTDVATSVNAKCLHFFTEWDTHVRTCTRKLNVTVTLLFSVSLWRMYVYEFSSETKRGCMKCSISGLWTCNTMERRVCSNVIKIALNTSVLDRMQKSWNSANPCMPFPVCALDKRLDQAASPLCAIGKSATGWWLTQTKQKTIRTWQGEGTNSYEEKGENDGGFTQIGFPSLKLLRRID